MSVCVCARPGALLWSSPSKNPDAHPSVRTQEEETSVPIESKGPKESIESDTCQYPGQLERV